MMALCHAAAGAATVRPVAEVRRKVVSCRHDCRQGACFAAAPAGANFPIFEKQPHAK
jgi:hypothetical protein